MKYIMSINEFKISELFKNKKKEKVTPKEDGGEPKQKNESELMLEFIKKLESVKYDTIIDAMKQSFGDKFDEKIVSEFKNAKWFECYGDDSVDEFFKFIPVGRFKELENELTYGGVTSTFYRFSLFGENNNLDIMCIHYWDYPLHSSESSEDEEWENIFFIGVISQKANN